MYIYYVRVYVDIIYTEHTFLLRWMIPRNKRGLRRSEIRARAGVANISEKMREARLRWLGHVEGNTDKILRTWIVEVDTER